jgi:hypothetical protein
MVNDKGTNQHGVKDCEFMKSTKLMINPCLDPPNSVLAEAFKKYSRANSGTGLNAEAQKDALKRDFGLDIGYA